MHWVVLSMSLTCALLHISMMLITIYCKGTNMFATYLFCSDGCLMFAELMYADKVNNFCNLDFWQGSFWTFRMDMGEKFVYLWTVFNKETLFAELESRAKKAESWIGRLSIIALFCCCFFGVICQSSHPWIFVSITLKNQRNFPPHLIEHYLWIDKL